MKPAAQNSKPSAKTKPPRGKPFQKGQSGNPGGRPKEAVQVRELARQHTELAIFTLIEVCERGDKDAARVAAAQALLDRGWGKPVTEIDLTLRLLKELEGMSDDQLARLADSKE
jgi:hypothetical protein